MPEPSPALVDSIARAMWEADDEPGSWDRHLDYAQTSLVGLDEVEAWRDRARAALAAMPQPIGYGVAWTAYGSPHCYRFFGEEPSGAEDAMVADLLRTDPDCGATVVALVPVGAPDA